MALSSSAGENQTCGWVWEIKPGFTMCKAKAFLFPAILSPQLQPILFARSVDMTFRFM